MENTASETVHPLDNILNSVTVDNGNLMDDLDPFSQTSDNTTTTSNIIVQPSDVNPATLNDDVFGPHGTSLTTDLDSNEKNKTAVDENIDTLENKEASALSDSPLTKIPRVSKYQVYKYVPPIF